MRKCLCCPAYFQEEYEKAEHMREVHGVNYVLAAGGYGYDLDAVQRSQKALALKMKGRRL